METPLFSFPPLPERPSDELLQRARAQARGLLDIVSVYGTPGFDEGGILDCVDRLLEIEAACGPELRGTLFPPGPPSDPDGEVPF